MTKYQIILTSTGNMPGGKSTRIGPRHYETPWTYNTGNTVIYETEEKATRDANHLVNDQTNGVESAKVVAI